MPQAMRCTVTLPPACNQLPLRINTRASAVSAVVLLALTVPAIALLAGVVAALGALGGDALAMAQHHPGAALQAMAGLGVCLALLALPALPIAKSLLLRQTIRIDENGVRVAERRFLRVRRWTTPLADFRGLTHVVRTTVSGQRHELVLLPRRQGRPLLLLAGETIAEDTVDGLARLLRLPAIPAGELRRSRHGQRAYGLRAGTSAVPASL
jgi:hypothetical protein